MSGNNYQLVCGLEIHSELKTKSKMFCACKNDPFAAGKPNIHTCPVCLGMPGGLPLANKKAIEWTIKIGLALNCQINLFSKFDRKNYFYPDLPKGYQISQHDIPFCHDGFLDTSQGRVRIQRIHLEEDTAKLIHQNNYTLIDFNRSGVPLVEIVTETDIKNAQQAKEYAQKLRQILRYLDVADCDMEKGGMRLEANISLKKKTDPDGFLPNYKVECKNINSFRFMEMAINYEMERQAKLLDQGQTPKQETRGFSAESGKTFSQRAKEEAEDYRYFPDPDLPPIEFEPAEIAQIKQELVELPDQYAARLSEEHQLSLDLAQRLVKNKKRAEFFEQLLILAKREKIESKKIINTLLNKKIDYHLSDDPKNTIEEYKKLNELEEMSPEIITELIKELLQENQDVVEKYQSGKTEVLAFLIGQSMKKIAKKVDVNLVKKVLLDQLNN
ncbi:MAG: Asp-tRNA(Asn)/Glu-tRNA(Gln) amidotransferase subunit GatB [Candidatus Pacebacteria bacterium]|jgi:aspartyl-tRNA(Asn)/glutamyl-tRNA(Gln) amidotransferase subunit B|nr:Asp-tRNA(Asn)/Glu-tRNA(Gln) amidotransferase subunit GatB [Candidatus Paceibacterota bacterium]